MSGRPVKRRLLGLAALVLGLAACAPASSGQSGGVPEARPAQGPKVLTLGMTTEPSDLGSFTATSGIRGSGNATMIAHAGLATTDEHEGKVPDVATEIPAVDRGTWLVNADGTMATTWKIRP